MDISFTSLFTLELLLRILAEASVSLQGLPQLCCQVASIVFCRVYRSRTEAGPKSKTEHLVEI